MKTSALDFQPGISRPASGLLAVLLVLACVALARSVAGAEDELPPPPEPLAEAAAPSIDLALLNPLLPGQDAEEVWSDSAPPRPLASAVRIPALALPVPCAAPIPVAPIPAAPTGKEDAPVKAMLATLNQDAPHRSTLESALFEQLQKAMPAGSEGYIFENPILGDSCKLPAKGWKVRYDFHLPASGLGQATFTANVTGDDDRILKRLSGSITIDREAQGVQVTRLVRQGETIRPEDVKAMGTRLSQLPRGAYDDGKRIEGTTARAELRPGQWLTEQMVAAQDLVKRNEAVTMRLVRGPIQITTAGLTHQAGARGEVIRVENMQSKREVYARVISKDEVQVIF